MVPCTTKLCGTKLCMLTTRVKVLYGGARDGQIIISKCSCPQNGRMGKGGGQLNQIISFYSSVMVTMICQETKLEK